MADDYQALLDNLRGYQRASARQAVDYLDGEQLPHFEEYLNTPGSGIKNWRDRGVLPLWENITGLIVDRSAQTYQQEPERIVINENGDEIEAGTQAYSELIENSNLGETLEDADLLARLLNASIVVAQYNDETGAVYFSAVSQHNADCMWNRPSQRLDSMIYCGGGVGSNGGMIYHYWDAEKVLDLEVRMLDAAGTNLNYGTQITIGGATVIDSRPHPYGLVPGAVLYDVKPPRAGFWGKRKWEQLINFNLGINMFHTEMKFNQRFQSFGQIITNAEVPADVIFGPDSIIKIKQQHPDDIIFFEYKAPTAISVAIKSFSDWLDSFRENIGQEWGVNIKVAGEGSADSGFKLVVEELPGLQLRKKRQKPADTFEQALYQVCLALSEAHGLGLVQGTRLKVKFPEPELPVNLKEKEEIRQMKLASKTASREMFWREDDPSLTEEDIDKRKAEIDAASAKIPTFAGINGQI